MTIRFDRWAAGRHRPRELIEASQVARIYEEEAVWKNIIRANVLFNFVQQLDHISVLAARTRMGLQT